MKTLKKDQLELYKSELVTAGIACVISLGLLVVAFTYNGSMTDEFEQLNTQAADQTKEINKLVEAKQLLEDIGGQFEHIKSNGFYGNEDRLSWAEALKRTASQLKLPNLKYSISPQEKVSELAVGFLPGLVLSQSTMNIEADLLHEGDLLSLSETLSSQSGLYRVLGCELQKEDVIVVKRIQKNVSLKCSLAWHTVKHDPSQDDMVEEDIDLEI